MTTPLTLCQHCNSMTKTIYNGCGKCGKCGEVKVSSEDVEKTKKATQLLKNWDSSKGTLIIN